MAHGLRNGGGLRGGRLRSKEDTDPMASVANIADIMLVFACGLMMALVTVWNIDFTPLSELQDKQLEALDTPEDMSDDGNAYLEKGMVYQDPKTGKYYMVTEDKDAMDSDLASQGTSSSDSASASSSSSSGSKSRAASPSGSTSASGSSSSAAAPDRSAGAD